MISGLKYAVLITLGFGFPSFVAYAEEGPKQADVLVYINPQEYQHPIKLWQFYYDYWYTQGQAVEPVAKQVLGADFGKVDMCEGNRTANALVRIQPRMFYNPHMRTFYGKIVANAYTGSGKPIATYVGESEKVGFLDVAPASKVEEAYRLAMQAAANKMKADPAFQEAVKQGVPESETSTPCTMASILPMAKN